jgi:hypothetical protein
MLTRTAYPALLLAIVSVCFYGYVLNFKDGIFHEFQAALIQEQWMLLVCLAVWFSTFIFLTFSLEDLPLIGLLLIAIAAFFISQANGRPAMDAIILLAGVTLGKGARFLLKADGRWQMADRGNLLNAECGTRNAECISEFRTPNSELRTFLVGLVLLLAFASWWHLDVAHRFYPGTRWTGLWDNPNIYGMLMAAGVVLAAGLLLADRRWKMEDGESARNQKSEFRSQNQAKRGEIVLRSLRFFAAIKSAFRTPHSALLFVAVGMMGVGLFFSYSRGAWLGTAVGLLYLAKLHGKFKWRYVVLGAGLVALGALLIWGRTPDDAPWYLKRMDLSRASAQHRVAAWRGAVQMMWDHPFGVGWNKAVETYEKNYSPPEDGAGAIATNDYLMLGTQLGLPGLLCFISYVALCLRSPKSKVQSPKSGNGASLDIGHWTLDSPQVACRAGALAMLVAFWFDGGLFTLATAVVFWVLLELSQMRNPPSQSYGATSAETG